MFKFYESHKYLEKCFCEISLKSKLANKIPGLRQSQLQVPWVLHKISQ